MILRVAGATAVFVGLCSAQTVFQITTPTPLPNGQVGVPYQVSFQATGGVPPYRWAINQSPIGLTFSTTAGTLSGTPSQAGLFEPLIVTVTDSTAASVPRTATKTFSLTVLPPPAVLQLSQQHVQFTARAGAEPPPPQWVSVLTDDPAGSSFTVSPDQVPWLTVAPARGVAPTRLTLRVDQGRVQPGIYTANVRVGGVREPLQVSLRVDPEAPPSLEAAPDVIRVRGRLGVAEQIERAVLVRNTGGGGAQPFTVAVVGGGNWLTVTPGSGSAGIREPATVQVRIRPELLRQGFHRGIIRIASPAGNREIPVSILIAPDAPVLALTPDGVQFEARQGNGTAVTRAVTVQNLGPGNLNWLAEVLQGGQWLSLQSRTGTATITQPGSLVVSANARTLPPGQYYGLVRVSAPATAPQFFTANLNVLPTQTAPTAAPSPSGLFFTAISGGQAPPAQIIRVFSSSDQPIQFRAGSSTEDSSGWLFFQRETTVTSTDRPGEVAVQVSPANLPPGVYKGEVGTMLADGTVRTVNITFVVTPRPQLTAVRQAAGCTPSQLVATHTGLISNFSTAVGWPTPLTVRVSDDCGDPVSNAAVVVNFTNGDPPMALPPGNPGFYTGTWNPGRVDPQIVVTARVTAPGRPVATATINGSSRESRTPVVTPNGVVNNLNRQANAPVAPGSVVEVYGLDLTATLAQPGIVPLPGTFNNTTVLIGGMEAPFYFLNSTQLNVQIPAELAPDNTYQLVVSANGALSVPERVSLNSIQPGVAAFPDGRAIAQHPDFTLVDISRPAAPGGFVTFYLVGMGETNPKVTTGRASPATEPLARVSTQPVVTIGGRPAQVVFAGLTPGAVGLYQINAQVPADLSNGDMDVEVSQGGVQANVVKLPVRRP